MTTEPMRDLTRVIDKIRKLFALGQSPNENEAAAAVAKAQALLEEYDLSMESIDTLKADPRTSVRESGPTVSTTDGKPDGWKADIFEAVAASSDCFTAYSYKTEVTKSGRHRTVKTGNLIGFGHDVEAAGYAFSFLVVEIERFATQYASTMWDEIGAMSKSTGISHQEAESLYVLRTGRHPLKAKLYFIRGAAEAVCSKLRSDHYHRRHQPADTPGCAIVLHKKAAVEDFIYMKRYGKTKAEFDAESEARWAKYREAATAMSIPAPVESDTQRMKREAKQKRERDREYQRWQAKQARERAKMDLTAHADGRATGENLSVRPGITGGVRINELKVG